jgi:hypothetical protein
VERVVPFYSNFCPTFASEAGSWGIRGCGQVPFRHWRDYWPRSGHSAISTCPERQAASRVESSLLLDPTLDLSSTDQ